MMGVPIKDPNTPPLEIVNVPPAISSRASVPCNDGMGERGSSISTPGRLTTVLARTGLHQ